MKHKQFIKQFNTPGTHLVISHWPTKNGSYDGIATYTEDITKRLADFSGDRFVVLAEGTEFGMELVNERILVIRAFTHDKAHVYPQILIWLRQFNFIRHVYVHSEFCASGGPSLRILMIPFLALIKFTGRQITFYTHNVVTDFSTYAPHFGTSARSWMLPVWSWGYRGYLRLLSWCVDRFIVLEPVIEKRLRPYVGKKPILVHPHWISPVKRMDIWKAKMKLGLSLDKKLIVSFGFVTWYKGADLMVRAAKEAGMHARQYSFALAGGEAYSLQNKKYYRSYYKKITSQARRLPNLTVTGFLSESEKHLWLSAADVIILPYRDLMGGSGALQQALRYGKPVLLSQPMAAHLGWFDHFHFSLHPQSIVKSIDDAMIPEHLTQLLKEVRRYKKSLAEKVLLPAHYQSVYADNQDVKVDAYGLVFSPSFEK